MELFFQGLWFTHQTYLFCSLDTKRISNYNTIGAAASGSPSGCNKLVFCVHGNKYGMARCCDDVVLSNKKPPDASSITMTGTLDDLEVPKESHRHGSSGGMYLK